MYHDATGLVLADGEVLSQPSSHEMHWVGDMKVEFDDTFPLKNGVDPGWLSRRLVVLCCCVLQLIPAIP